MSPHPLSAPRRTSPDTRQEVADRQKGTAALAKGIRLFNAIASATTHPTPLQFSEITGLPRPTVHRLLATLKREGLMRRTAKNDGYRLGPAVVMFAHRAPEPTDILDIAHEHMETLREVTGETVHLANLTLATANRASSYGPTNRPLHPGFRLKIRAPECRQPRSKTTPGSL